MSSFELPNTPDIGFVGTSPGYDDLFALPDGTLTLHAPYVDGAIQVSADVIDAPQAELALHTSTGEQTRLQMSLDGQPVLIQAALNRGCDLDVTRILAFREPVESLDLSIDDGEAEPAVWRMSGPDLEVHDMVSAAYFIKTIGCYAARKAIRLQDS